MGPIGADSPVAPAVREGPADHSVVRLAGAEQADVAADLAPIFEPRVGRFGLARPGSLGGGDHAHPDDGNLHGSVETTDGAGDAAMRAG